MISYSKVDQISLNNADNSITEGTLVLEGGAFRGVYTSGVLDCLMDNNINLSHCVGISAGSLNGTNYIAGNRGASGVLNLKYRRNHNYVGIKPLIKNHSVVNFDFMFDKTINELGLNKDRLFSSDRKLYVGATSLSSGITKFFSNNESDIFFDAIRASSSMPLVSKSIEIKDDHYLDGGCSTKLPIKFVLDNKFPKPIVVLTREYGYRRKEVSKEFKLEKIIYKNYPEFIKALENANKQYNEDSKLIEDLAKEKKLYLITPSLPVHISRLEKDMEKLGALYELGYSDCEKQLDQIKQYLNIK